MKTHSRGTQRRVPVRTALSASLAVLGLFGGSTAAVAQANDRSDASCRQETKRVAVWPKGPKTSQMARFEEREVTVCDGKVTSSRAPEAARESNSSGD
ncbi:MAG TPA: hypothetical protein VGD45_12960 [Steroidobacter sp.]|uniref:hypothetical protein n=1 Tax=Steroidobacter sp. TaxID=1978227 RepID=UPI002ED97BF2